MGREKRSSLSRLEKVLRATWKKLDVSHSEMRRSLKAYIVVLKYLKHCCVKDKLDLSHQVPGVKDQEEGVESAGRGF